MPMEREKSHNELDNRPEPLPVNFERIPARLRDKRQFVVWAYQQVDDELKKPPFDPRTGRLASVAKSTSWGSLADAKRAYDTGNYAGIGIVLTRESGIVGIDLDHCVEEGHLSKEAGQIIDSLASYTEVSPSGTGIHILLEGRLPGPYRRRGKVEMYEELRYLSLTGHTLVSSPSDILPRQNELQHLYQRLFTGESRIPDKENTGGGRERHWSPPPVSAEVVLEKAMKAKNGVNFKRYYGGDPTLWEGAGARHRSQSEADFTLVLMLLYWTNNDAGQAERLFRQSGLMRPKWDRPVKGAETYGERLIRDALAKGRH
jgi:putative DNA primase/helicase